MWHKEVTEIQSRDCEIKSHNCVKESISEPADAQDR